MARFWLSIGIAALIAAFLAFNGIQGMASENSDCRAREVSHRIALERYKEEIREQRATIYKQERQIASLESTVIREANRNRR